IGLVAAPSRCGKQGLYSFQQMFGHHAHLTIVSAVMKKSKQSTEATQLLQGWKAIAEFMGQHVATAQHWGRSGMPVSRQGRYTVADREALRRWVGQQSGMKAPAHIA